MSLPSGFIDMIRRLIPAEADEFLKSMELPPATSVRLNSRKPGASFPDAIPVKWCSTGLYLPQRPLFTLDPLLHAGAYYVQDASSMIYHEVTKRLVGRFSEISGEEHQKVSLLDMCAAPGGKTTAMIDSLPDGSRVVANEYVGKRAAILRENIAKWGYPDVTVTNSDSSRFATDRFDIVAVDAPCSGEGMMRKEPAAVAQWSESLIADCASLQKEILTNAADALKPGGFLIYSTCTFNRYENEENAEFIASRLGLESVDMEFPEEWGIPHGIDTNLHVYRFMPHKTEGEGLFLAVFHKPGEWIPDNFSPMAKIKRNRAKGNDRHIAKGGKESRKSQEEIPPIEEILSLDFDRTKFPEAEVSKDQAIAYLRRESIILPPDVPKGLVVITYKKLPLGMAKNIGSRANNLYPKNWRILMQ